MFGSRYLPHCFRNAGDTIGHLIIIYTPAGNERFFLQLDEWTEHGVDITFEKIKTLADSMGNYLVPQEAHGAQEQ
ncbi:hypothetical protein KSX_01940 [Ktedonospora formicarum]|uniref:Uncharacterized protein n=1 Tax=Ktedonospora formicarum TaxID=2778364 RepID=A0A8J3HU56_9CHLR|nr:hypothetical protein KSX_01940 [Ktedonospora formicarum]